jgi:hypothetical protein
LKQSGRQWSAKNLLEVVARIKEFGEADAGGKTEVVE